MAGMKGIDFSRIKIFSVCILQKIKFDFSCKLSPKQTVCLEYQTLFSGKNEKNITSLLSAKFAHSVFKVNVYVKN